MNTNNNILTQTCCTQSQLLAYASNTLTAQETAMVEHHFSSCALCSDAIDGLFALSADDQIDLLSNKNPFKTNEEKQKPLHFGFKKNKIWQIAALLLVMIGTGFGYQIWHNNHQDNVMAKLETTSIKPIENQKIVTSADAKKSDELDITNTENKVVATIPVTTNDCPPNASKVKKSPEIIAEVEANKYTNYDKVLRDNENFNPVESKKTEKLSDNNTTQEKASMDIAQVQLQKKDVEKNVLPAPVVTNMSTNNNINNATNAPSNNTTPIATYDNASQQIKKITLAKTAKRKAIEIATLKEESSNENAKNRITLENTLATIQNLFETKQYAKTIETAENFLATTTSDKDAKAIYYLALSYDNINNRKKAIEKMKIVANSKNDFTMLAKEKLAFWNANK